MNRRISNERLAERIAGMERSARELGFDAEAENFAGPEYDLRDERALSAQLAEALRGLLDGLTLEDGSTASLQVRIVYGETALAAYEARNK